MTSRTQTQKIERIIVRRVVLDLLTAGYLLNVSNGGCGHELPAPSARVAEVLGAMFATDHDVLCAFVPGSDGVAPRPVGWVEFIYGNSGWDVIADNTLNLEKHLAGATELSNRHSR